MGRELLKHIYYGDEVERADALMSWPRKAFGAQLSEDQFGRILAGVSHTFSNIKEGVFGGPITAGDASMIATLMEVVRPAQMVEFGVASGFSSSFILDYARRAGLLGDGVFLHSFDLCEEHVVGEKVGNYLRVHHSDLARHWSLNTEVTSATLLERPELLKLGSGPVLAFVDGGHNHPWPILDLIYLYKTLPRGSWVVLQDLQMMERWIADCVIYDAVSPHPVRGVNYTVSHWPGTKILGFDMAYNSAVIRLDIPDWQFRGFVEDARKYPYEIGFEYDRLLNYF